MIRNSSALFLVASAIVGACSSASTSTAPAGPAPTPTPSVMTRVNPYIVEETDSYTIQRYPKSEYLRVDDRHIRHPLVKSTVEFFREDDLYYYVSVPKTLPDEQALRRQSEPPKERPPVRRPEYSTEPGPPPSDFTDLLPARRAGRIRLEKVDSGLPATGLWRSSFEIADVNGDGSADIVSPPSRIGGHPMLHVWVGDGKESSPLAVRSRGRQARGPEHRLRGAVRRHDGTGKVDSRRLPKNGGLEPFFGDGKGGFGSPGGLPQETSPRRPSFSSTRTRTSGST